MKSRKMERILVIDDDVELCTLVGEYLLAEGFTVEAVHDGENGLQRASGGGYLLVVLDVMLPGINGFEVLRRIRATSRLPVLLLTARGEDVDRIVGLEIGADDYLPKPFNPTLLRARVGASLERKRLHDQVAAQAADLAAWNRTLEQRVEQQLCEIERVSRLKRFLSPQVTELILSSGDERVLESHRRAITVLFCDLRGFTAFSETTEPEEVMAVLREYHAVLGSLIHKHEGTVERFAGDAIMVLFNDPLPCSDPNLKAVQMAIDMREQVGALASKWRKQGYELGFGIGIAHGYATLGRIGFEGRFDYGAVGTVVNLAARLCSEAKDGQILIEGKVHSAIEETSSTEPAGELTLKGIMRPVRIFNVCGLQTAPA